MKIGFNAQIIEGNKAGVATFAEQLLRALVNEISEDELHIFGNPRNIRLPDAKPNVHVHATRDFIHGSLRRILWEQLVLPSRAIRAGIDVMFYPDHVAPLFLASPSSIITIHDLAFIAMPETFSTASRRYKTFALRRSLRRVDGAVTVSSSTLRECKRLLGFAVPSQHVAHPGIRQVFSPFDDGGHERVRAKLALPSKYILYIGTLEPRKNLLTLIKAYSILHDRITSVPNLVIAGGKGWLYGDIFREVKQLQLEDSVHFTGYIDDEDLPSLYRMADVFVYPSLYEGFGVPPLEAMACGIPVITTNSTSLPEVCGDAALFIDGRDPHELADAIHRLLKEEPLRRHLRERGLRHVKQFTYQRTAREILRVVTSLRR